MKDKMTLEQFFRKGYKFVDGDIYLECSGYAVTVGEDISPFKANKRDYRDDQRTVIIAKALEESKPSPCLNTAYEEITFEKLSEAFAAHEETPLYSYHCDGYGVASNSDIIAAFDSDGRSVYRKIETTPMEAAKRVCEDSVEINEQIDFCSSFGDFLEDNTVWKGYDLAFIDICRTIVEAYDGKGK